MYPTETVDDCIADIAVLPITDDLVYNSNLNAGLTFPSANILGSFPDGNHDHPTDGYNEGVLIHAGESAGSIALTQTEFFDLFPSTPVQPTLCDGADNCFDVILENGQTITGGNPLPGFAGGYVLKGHLPSIAPSENCCADLYLEWHAIDGPISGSGLGDIIGEDEEDFDGTDFDRVWAMESLMATYLSSGPGCGYNYPIFGDITTQLESMGLANCFDRVDIATEGYVFDESNTDYGNLVTYNSLTGGVDDSDHDYNGIDGRMVMQFDPLCIRDINVRHIMLEFLEVGEEGVSCVDDYPDDCCAVLGDLNGDVTTDGSYNVLDIVLLANCVLTQSCANDCIWVDDEGNACGGAPSCSACYGCAADLNGDGGYNVLDIVILANCVLAGNCGG